MSDPLKEVATFREAAVEMRRRAQVSTIPAASSALLAAAETYEGLAKAAEEAVTRATRVKRAPDGSRPVIT